MSINQVRAASLDQLLADLVPQFLTPVPPRDTFRYWLDRNNVPRFKSNPTARRGGGTVYYSVSATEKMLRQMMPKMRVTVFKNKN